MFFLGRLWTWNIDDLPLDMAPGFKNLKKNGACTPGVSKKKFLYKNTELRARSLEAALFFSYLFWHRHRLRAPRPLDFLNQLYGIFLFKKIPGRIPSDHLAVVYFYYYYFFKTKTAIFQQQPGFFHKKYPTLLLLCMNID